jgi:hypothetical protein
VVERGTPYASLLLMVEKEYNLHVHTAEPIFLDYLWPFTQGIPRVFWPNALRNLGKEANPWGTPGCYFPRLDPGEI